MRALAAIAANARWLLPAGLALGLAFPPLALALRPAIGPMIVALLFLTTLRIGPEALCIGAKDLPRTLGRVAVLQLALPLATVFALTASGHLSHPTALATILILAGAPITGAAPIAQLSGGDPAPALRQTILGTALLPLTALPVFLFTPGLGTQYETAPVTLRLLAVILIAGGLAIALRGSRLIRATPRTLTGIDAASALLLATTAIGLMAPAAETLRTAPATFAAMLAYVSALCFALQIVALRLGRPPSPALAVTAGNRNVSLFLTAIPASTADPLLFAIGCYQIPMFLTPVVLPLLMRWQHQKTDR